MESVVGPVVALGDVAVVEVEVYVIMVSEIVGWV